MTNLILETAIKIEMLFSKSYPAELSLQSIADAILDNGSPLNLLEMLKLSCEYDNNLAQESYLSIIAECVRVFENYIKEIASLKSEYSSGSLYYYFEFLLGCDVEFSRDVIDGLNIDGQDLAYPLYKKLADILS